MKTKTPLIFYDENWNPLEDLKKGKKIPKEIDSRLKIKRKLKRLWLLTILGREDRACNKILRRRGIIE